MGEQLPIIDILYIFNKLQIVHLYSTSSTMVVPSRINSNGVIRKNVRYTRVYRMEQGLIGKPVAYYRSDLAPAMWRNYD